LPGPCFYTVCRFNLTAELRDKRGAKPSAPQPPVIHEACALEAAEQGGMTLAAVALRLSLTRERVRQIEEVALKKMWALLGEAPRGAERPRARRPAVVQVLPPPERA
jgi:hypothetical protein